MDVVQRMRVFVRVAELGSFRRAAKEFGLSNPAVTRCIVSLETRLRVQLMHRSTRVVTLTDPGRQYLDGCRAWLEHFDELEAAVVHRDTLKSQDVASARDDRSSHASGYV
jgi:DNA-binding transcriptional LysR family regulator